MFFYDKIVFKQKTLNESAYDLLKRAQTSHSLFEKRKASAILDGQKPSFENYKECLKKDFGAGDVGEQLHDVQDFWCKNSRGILKELSQILQIEMPLGDQVLCFGDQSPNTVIDYDNVALSLSGRVPYQDNTDFFVTFLVKFAVVRSLWGGKHQQPNVAYSNTCAYLVMADLVADSICFYSRLSCFDFDPAYKLYYAISINGENLMNKLHEAYMCMPIFDFVKYVMSFVEKNWEMFEQFKNR